MIVVGYRSPSARAWWTSGCLGILGLLMIASFISTIAEINLLEKVEDGEFISEAELASNDNRQTAIGGLYLLAFILTVVAVCLWIHRASENLRSLGVAAQRFSPGWAVGWWFIPIMHLFRPYQVVKELWEASYLEDAYADPIRRSSSIPTSSLLGWWWGAWIIGGIIGNVVLRGWFNAETAGELKLADQISLFSDALTFVTGLLFFALLHQITTMQDGKNRELERGPPPAILGGIQHSDIVGSAGGSQEEENPLASDYTSTVHDLSTKNSRAWESH